MIQVRTRRLPPTDFYFKQYILLYVFCIMYTKLSLDYSIPNQFFVEALIVAKAGINLVFNQYLQDLNTYYN